MQKLVVVSLPFSQRGWYPEIFAAIARMGPSSAEAMKQSPLYQVYASVAPRPEDWPILHSKLPGRTHYDIMGSPLLGSLVGTFLDGTKSR